MSKQIIAIAILISSTMGFSQGPPSKGKVDAMKIAFITKRLNLTEEEAQKFWPVYNKYEAEKDALRAGTVEQYKEDNKPIDEMSDAEAEKMINDFIAFRSKDVDLMKKYIAEFRKVLPVKKVAKLVTAEEHFKKMLMKKAQEGDGPPHGPGPKPKPGGQ